MLAGDLGALPGSASEGASLVGVTAAHDAVAIVSAINEFVASPPKPGFLKKVDNWLDRAVPLGALWGSQLVQRFGWGWVMVEDGGETSIAVVDGCRSMVVFPFDYVYGCLESGGYPTILLSFNMLADGGLPTFPDRSYTSIMDGIQHIVPPV